VSVSEFAGTPRVLIIGASLTSGLGYDGVPFARLAADALGSDVLDLAYSGQTTAGVLADSSDQIRDFQPHLAILEIGGTEAMIHPGRRTQALIERWAPESWHGVAGLEPRARYSRQRRRRLRQRVSSHAKVALKKVLFKMLGGGSPRVDQAQSLASAHDLLELLRETGTKLVVLGLPDTDERLFPGTNESFRRWNHVLDGLAATTSGSLLVPLSKAVHQWDDFLADHLHFNRAGHERAAEAILTALGRSDLTSVTDSSTASGAVLTYGSS
jgi:lysophospholipase L1-like esterase